MKTRRYALFALVVLALAAAGCGGSDSGGSAAEATDTTSTEVTSTDTTGAGDQTSTDEMASTDEATGTDSTTSTDESTGTDSSTSTQASGGIGDLSGECLSLASVGAKYAEALQQASGNAKGDLSTYSKVFEQFAKDAPKEIRADLEVIAKNLGKYAESLKGLDLSSGKPPTAEQLAKLQELSKSFNQAELQKASQHIEAWVTANCSKS